MPRMQKIFSRRASANSNGVTKVEKLHDASLSSLGEALIMKNRKPGEDPVADVMLAKPKQANGDTHSLNPFTHPII